MVPFLTVILLISALTIQNKIKYERGLVINRIASYANLLESGVINFESVKDKDELERLFDEEVLTAKLVRRDGNVAYSTGGNAVLPQEKQSIDEALQGYMIISNETRNNKPILVYSYPITVNHKSVGVFYLELSCRRINDRIKVYFYFILLLNIIGLAISYFFTHMFAQAIILKRLDELTKAAAQIARGNLDYRLAVNSGDELGIVASSFNNMASELGKTEKELKEQILIRKKVEIALAEESQWLEVTLGSIGDGVIATNTQEQIMLFNKAAEAITSQPYSEAIGKPFNEVFNIIDERNRVPCPNPVETVLKSGKPCELSAHTVLLAKNGAEKIIADSAAPILDKNHNILGVVVVFRDITEKRKMEDELLKTLKLESLGVLAGGIAHDFNNLLTGIIGNISIVKMYHKPDEKEYKIYSYAERALQRASELVHQLLTFAKGGAPIKHLAKISDLLKDTAKFSLAGSMVKPSFTIALDLWPAEVDKGNISQVIQNLVINAKEAMPNGGQITITAENTVLEDGSKIPLKPGKYLKITVRDQGTGINPQYLAKIFDPYFTTKQTGSGLGLAAVYSIIKKHDGYIAVESQIGIGTTFSIYLPASERQLAEQKEKADIKTYSGRCKILVIDDEELIRTTAVNMIKALNYQVETAPNAQKAFEKFLQAQEAGEPFDAAIIDSNIPGSLDGKEIVKRLLLIDPNLKTVISSGSFDSPVMTNFQEYGFKARMPKPYDLQMLHDVLSQLMKDK